MSRSSPTHLTLLALVSAFVAAGAATPAQAAQNTPCGGCEQYRSLVHFSSLADKVGEIGIKAIHDDGQTFAAIQDEAKALRLRISANTMIPEECRKKLIAETNRWNFHLRGSYGFLDPKNAMSAQDNVQANRVMNAYYNGYINGFKGYGGSNQQSYADYSAYLSQPASSVAAGLNISESDARMLKLYHQWLNAGTEKAALALVASKKDGLSNEEFLHFVQMVGSTLGGNYDYGRAGQAFSAKGAIDGDAMLKAARDNFINGDGTESAGVCRDISSFQAKLLDARGFKNTYVVAHSVEGNYHVTVITQDPDKPRTLEQFNYEVLRTAKDVEGSIALYQGGEDVATQYRIYKPGGRQVGVVPSEMGKFLAESAGFDIHVMDPLARSNGWMVSGEAGKSHFQIRAIDGTDGNGANYVGGAATASWAEGRMGEGKVGVFVGQQTRPGAIIDSATDRNAVVAYAQLEQHVKAVDVQLTPKLRLQQDNYVTLSAMAHKGTSGSTELSGDGDLRLNAELRVLHADGPYKGVYRVGAQVSPGLGDVRDLRTPTAAFNQVYIEGRGTLQLKDMVLFGDTLVVIDQMGARGKLEVGAAGRTIAGSAYVAGRITNDTALLQDNSLRRAGVAITFRPIRYVNASVAGEIPMEGDDPVGRIKILGRLGFDY